MTSLKLLQIVRRYGPVGGMERYVWELTRELAGMGHQVTVLCEVLAADAAPAGVKVVELGSVQPRPRWLAHLRFSRRVSAWVANHPNPERIIHSHERTAVHHVTTFHGPPFASIRKKPLWQRLSLRVAANLWLERRELCGKQVRCIIPNSPLIAEAINHYYPQIGERLCQPVAPGVGEIPARPARMVEDDGGVIGFVGKEWKRKGLDRAVEIVAELRKQRPKLRFAVAGPKPEEVRHLFDGWPGGYELLGETDSTPLYAEFDLLLHPARQEPYGMVIAEARAAGVPVLVSDACGIASELDGASVLDGEAGLEAWVERCQALIGIPVEPLRRGWRQVAEDQVRCYRSCLD